MSSTEFPSRPQPASGLLAFRSRDSNGDVSATEPAVVFLLKSLLYPVIPLLTLLVCLAFEYDRPHGPYLLIAVLSFLGVANLLDIAPLKNLSASVMALRSLFDITLRWALLMAFLFVLLEVSRLSENFNGTLLAAWALVTPVVLWVGESVARTFLQRASARDGQKRRALIVGATSVGVQLEHNLRRRPGGHVNVVGYFEDRVASRIPFECRDRILGQLKDVGSYVSRNGIDTVYVTLPMNPQPRIVELINSLRDSTASVYFVPDFHVFDLVQPRFDLVDNIPVIAVCESPFYGVHGVAKRLSDILIAALALVLTAPLLLIVAACVRLTSPGPAIYRQRRYGLDGREIVVFKFRSLRVMEDGEQNYTQVSRDDTRLTRFGAFIRRTSLDELPQLFNVLLGDMSIVGPRPHAIAVNEQYRRQIPGYMVRHKVKPGITGWAQVNGYRGGDDLDSMTMRIMFDLEYLRHWSLGLDLIIVLKTARMIWKDRHAY